MNPSFSQDPTQRTSFSYCPRTRHFPAITFNARETLDNDGTVCSTIHSQSRIGKNIRRGLRKLRTDAEGRSQQRQYQPSQFHLSYQSGLALGKIKPKSRVRLWL